MKNTREVVMEWVRMVNEEASKPLTKKEQNFIDDISDHLDRGGTLTGPQEDWLEGIYANKTS